MRNTENRDERRPSSILGKILQPLKFRSRRASLKDIFPIMKLYADAYDGRYSDPVMGSHALLSEFLDNKNHYWFITEFEGEVVASVVIRHDPHHLIAKAFGAVVKDSFRRNNLMESLLDYAIENVRKISNGVDIVYATTRTVHEGAQGLTEKLGFKKLGIFPNSHKTAEFETHCLAARYFENSFTNRFTEYKLHHALIPLVELAGKEIPSLLNLKPIVPHAPTRKLVSPPPLELVDTVHFVKYRYHSLKSGNQLQFAFFPFHEPNVLILSPDQSTELFCYLSKSDGYSVIIGGKVGENINFTELFDSVSNILRDHQARYVEALIRADKPKIIDAILASKFIPSAFFPAVQLHHGKRYDYVVMSKTFELFDFKNIKLQGLNQMFLEEYFRHWKQTALP